MIKLPSQDRRAAGSRSGSDIKRRRVVAVRRETFGFGYHPGASRHPSCSRRGGGISNEPRAAPLIFRRPEVAELWRRRRYRYFKANWNSCRVSRCDFQNSGLQRSGIDDERTDPYLHSVGRHLFQVVGLQDGRTQ